MGDQILTQNEVDALLKGISNGKIKVKKEEKEEKAQDEKLIKWDFTKHSKVKRQRMPVLEMIADRFSKEVRPPLSMLLKQDIEVSTEGIRSERYGDFIKQLPLPSSINIFHMPPLKGQGLLVIDPNLAFQVVENYFGGTSRFNTKVEGREFTNIEQMVIKKFIDIIFKHLVSVWKTVYPIELKYVRTETNPQYVTIISPTDTMVIIEFSAELDGTQNKFYFCMPYFSIEPIKEKLFGGTESIELDQHWSSRIKERVMTIPLTLTGVMGYTDLMLSDVVKLKEGDIIKLDSKESDPIEVLIEGIPKFIARAGLVGKNYSLEILAAIKEGG